MARRRRSRNASPDLDAVFQPPIRPLAVTLFNDLPSFGPLTEVEDRRQYHPLDFHRPAVDLGGTPTGPVVPAQKPFKVQMPFGLKFAVPEKTAICVRRKTRKEVLHAKRKTGRGKARRRPSKNWFSKIGC